jgi:hypothetical protein
MTTVLFIVCLLRSKADTVLAEGLWQRIVHEDSHDLARAERIAMVQRKTKPGRNTPRPIVQRL